MGVLLDDRIEDVLGSNGNSFALEFTSQSPACPSVLFPQIPHTWSAKEVAIRVSSSRLAVTFHICSQPVCWSLSSHSRITPASRERGCHAHRDIRIYPESFECTFCSMGRGWGVGGGCVCVGESPDPLTFKIAYH
jgi:hypothetical protein